MPLGLIFVRSQCLRAIMVNNPLPQNQPLPSVRMSIALAVVAFVLGAPVLFVEGGGWWRVVLWAGFCAAGLALAIWNLKRSSRSGDA